MESVDWPESKMKVEFRAVENGNKVLCRSEFYEVCESFVRSYDGPGEIQIKKVFVRKDKKK